MTERSIFSGKTPQVVIRSGADVLVKGWDSDRILAESSGVWGLQVKRKKGAIEVQIGGSGQVLVPYDSRVTIYAGKSSEVQEIQGTVRVIAGWDVRIAQSNVLAQASAGRKMEIDCLTIEGRELKLSSGWHMRCWIRELRDVRYLIDDLGGKWQATFGDGSTRVQLKAGGDVTLVSDQPVTPGPEDLVGKIILPGVDSVANAGVGPQLNS
jgi:hypothetical protein